MAQIIVEMRNVAESGKEFGIGTRSTCPLVFPDFIMGFLIASRVRIPNVVPFEIKTKVNDTYVDMFCMEKKKNRRKVEQMGQTSSNTLNYGDWYPRLCQAFTYTWDQNDSIHMVVISLHDSFYMLHIQPEGQPDAGHHFMTLEEFQTHIAWHGDMLFYQGETTSHGDKNDEKDAEAETKSEEGTSEGSIQFQF